MQFKRLNNNPYDKKVGDCAVRAIASAFNVDWASALQMLVNSSFNTGRMPNDVWNIHEFLKSQGWKRTILIHPKKIKDMRFRGTHLIHISHGKTKSGHMTYVENGVLIDSWDSRNEKISWYYTKES